MRIVISGTVGVGKSSTVKLLVKELRKKDYTINHIDEKTAKSPFLSYYYNEPSKWAFISQLDFLFERFKQLTLDENLRKKEKELGNKNKIISIYDRHVVDDLIFSELKTIKDSVSENESLTYKMAYNELLNRIEDHNLKPDYFFLLEASLPTIVKRLHKRGRREEKDTDEHYWEELYNSYYNIDKYQKHFKNHSKKVININTDELIPEVVVAEIIKKLNI